jgi:hypothetical protein
MAGLSSLAHLSSLPHAIRRRNVPSLPTSVWVFGKYGGPYMFDVVQFSELPQIHRPVVYIVA